MGMLTLDGKLRRIIAILLSFVIAFGCLPALGGADKAYAAADIDSGVMGQEEVPWRITSDGVLIIGDGSTTTLTMSKKEDGKWEYYPWAEETYTHNKEILKLQINGTIKPNTLYFFLHHLSRMTKADLRGLDTSNVESMNGMFDVCSSLTEIIWPETLDTSKVTDMQYMFHNCEALTKLDISNFDTRYCYNMQAMFSGCSSLEKLNVGNFETSYADWISMFSNCSSLEGADFSNFDFSAGKVTSMFAGADVITSEIEALRDSLPDDNPYKSKLTTQIDRVDAALPNTSSSDNLTNSDSNRKVLTGLSVAYLIKRQINGEDLFIKLKEAVDAYEAADLSLYSERVLDELDWHCNYVADEILTANNAESYRDALMYADMINEFLATTKTVELDVMIDSLPDSVTWDDRDAVDEASAIYESLTEDEKDLIDPNKEDKLLDAITEINSLTVAKIGTERYRSLAEAITAAGTTETEITLVNNTVESVVIPAGAVIVLDLNDYKITNKPGLDTIENNGTLNLKCDEGEGQGEIYNYADTKNQKAGLKNNIGATASINGAVRLYRDSDSGTADGYVIYNRGTMTINEGVIVENISPTQSASTINTGHYTLKAELDATPPLIDKDNIPEAKLTINGGTISGGVNSVKVDSAGVLEIYGGTISNPNGTGILNWNKAEINGGSITAKTTVMLGQHDWTGSAGVIPSSPTEVGAVTITGGQFVSTNENNNLFGQIDSGNNRGGSSVNISGGTFDGMIPDLNVQGKHPAEVNVTGGRFKYDFGDNARVPDDKILVDDGDGYHTLHDAVWVTFDPNGGALTDPSKASYKIEKGTITTAPEATKTNDTLRGWKTSQNSSVYDFSNAISQDMTFVASWTNEEEAAKVIDISKAIVTGISDKVYTGKAITQTPTVKVDGKTLKSGTDYTLSYKNNVKVGTATVTVTGKGKYTGTVSKNFKITTAKATKRRLEGADRFGTSTAVAKTYKKDSKQTAGLNAVVVANAFNPADALSAGPLAAKYKAPILLIDEAHEKSVLNWIKKNVNKGKTVYLVGGHLVVTNRFRDSVKAAGYKCVRVAGPDRIGTNLAVLNELKLSNKDELLVTEGSFKTVNKIKNGSFHEALIASATGKPLMLVNSGGLTAAQKNFLKKNKVKSITVIGSTKSVPAAIQTALKTYNKSVARVKGNNADELSVAVAKKYWPDGPTQAFLATSNNFADALSGCPECIINNGPIFLVNEKNYSATSKYLKSLPLKRVTVFGGPLAVSEALVTKCANLK